MTLQVKISKKLVSYETAFSFLKKRVELIKKSKGKELVWILEHPKTYTSGIRSNKNEILDKLFLIIPVLEVHFERQKRRIFSCHCPCRSACRFKGVAVGDRVRSDQLWQS